MNERSTNRATASPQRAKLGGGLFVVCVSLCLIPRDLCSTGLCRYLRDQCMLPENSAVAKTVLIADNDLGLAEMLARRCESIGLKTIVVDNAECMQEAVNSE